MNKCVFGGRVVRTPELTLVNGAAKVSLSLALKREWKNDAGEYEADFADLVAWRQTADFISRYVRQGDYVEAVCAARTRAYEKEGGKRVFRYFDCEHLQLVAHPKARADDAPPPPDDFPDDGFDFGEEP